MIAAIPCRASWVVALGLPLLILSGCSSAKTRSEERRVLVEPGMTGKEVVARIGRPNKAFTVNPLPGVTDQTTEVWAYTMKVPPNVGDAVEVGLNTGALVLLCVATGGHDSSVLNGIKVPNKGSFAFWVGFGADGRVRGVTNLELIR